jgi:hypothetical protein
MRNGRCTLTYPHPSPQPNLNPPWKSVSLQLGAAAKAEFAATAALETARWKQGARTG